MSKSFIEGIRDWLKESPVIKEFCEILSIDSIDTPDSGCAVVPSGQEILEEYVSGGAEWQYTADFVIIHCTPDNAARLENAGWIERMIRWIREQDSERNFPECPDYADIHKVTPSGGMLFELAENGLTGVYRFGILLNYTERI